MVTTKTSDVFKVKFQNSEAVLKLLNTEGQVSEAKGALALRCFNGRGAARLFAADAGAHLLEYVDGPALKSLVLEDKDAEATGIICDVLENLHSYSGSIPEGTVILRDHFRSLFKRASAESSTSLFGIAAEVAEKLFATEKNVGLLHGDIHHENILHSSARGWLAIDPKYLSGERTYDVANVFYNPMNETEKTASVDVINRRASILAQRLHLDRQRVLEFAFAYGCLSASWSLEDNQSPADALKIASSIRTFIKV